MHTFFSGRLPAPRSSIFITYVDYFYEMDSTKCSRFFLELKSARRAEIFWGIKIRTLAKSKKNADSGLLQNWEPRSDVGVSDPEDIRSELGNTPKPNSYIPR